MLKKVFVALILGSLLMGAVLPLMVLAQEPLPESCIIRRDPKITDCPTSGACPYATNKMCGLCCMISTIYYVSDWIFTFLIVLVIIFVLWGAFSLLTSAGDPEQWGKGRERIMWAAIGLGAALFAKAVPAIVRYLVAP